MSTTHSDVQETKPAEDSLRSSSPSLRIHSVANGYVVDATENRNMGYGSNSAQTFVFSGPDAELDVGLFVQQHFKGGCKVDPR